MKVKLVRKRILFSPQSGLSFCLTKAKEKTEKWKKEENYEEVFAHPAVGAEIVPHCLPLLLWVDKSSHLKDLLIKA